MSVEELVAVGVGIIVGVTGVGVGVGVTDGLEPPPVVEPPPLFYVPLELPILQVELLLV